MSKAVKVWLTVATVLVVLGVLIFGVVMTINHWDFSRLGTVKYETNTYEFDETFQDLSIHTDVADLLFVPSDDETCKVVCYERQMMHHNVEVKNGTLYIRAVDANAWYEFIGITLETPKITVYLPQKAYNALVIDGSVGTVELPDAFSFETALTAVWARWSCPTRFPLKPWRSPVTPAAFCAGLLSPNSLRSSWMWETCSWRICRRVRWTWPRTPAM